MWELYWYKRALRSLKERKPFSVLKLNDSITVYRYGLSEKTWNLNHLRFGHMGETNVSFSIERVHRMSRWPCWRSKQGNGGHLGGVGLNSIFMQIPPFVSLCKYGFWSHERTHSIALTHWPPMHTAVNKRGFACWLNCNTSSSNGSTFMSVTLLSPWCWSSCVWTVTTCTKDQWKPTDPHSPHHYTDLCIAVILFSCLPTPGTIITVVLCSCRLSAVSVNMDAVASPW